MINVEEYNRTVKEYTKNIFRFLYRSLHDEEAVNDIIQDCFMKLWQNRKSIDPEKVKSWLFSVAHNAMINYLKTNSRKVKLEGNTEYHAVFQKHDFDIKSVVENTLNELPEIQKSIILLRDLEGYEYREIGEILGLSDSQVKVYLFRARLKVKNAIKNLTNVI